MVDSLQCRIPPGSVLAERRMGSQMTTAQVSRALLLSQRHIEALEADDPSAFYNASFYEQARRRYAELLGLELPADAPPPSTSLLASGTDGVTASSPMRGSRIKTGPHAHSRKSNSRWIGVVWVAIGAAGLVTWYGFGPFGLPTANDEARPDRSLAAIADAPANAEPPASVEAPADAGPRTDTSVPAQVVTTPPASAAPDTGSIAIAATASTAWTAEDSSGYLFEAHQPCWIFARKTDGDVTTLTLKAGQRLTLPKQLRYLAIGDITAVRLWTQGTERDLQRFSADGHIVRLGLTELRALQVADSTAFMGSD